MKTPPRWFQFIGCTPDPGRKSPHLLIFACWSVGRYEVHCCCGKLRPDGGCRHTDVTLRDLKPWYRARTRLAPKREEKG